VSTHKPIKTMTKAERKAPAAKAAKLRAGGASGMQLRTDLHPGLTGPVRRSLFREFGHDGLIAASYDRAEAKVKREASEAEAAKAKPAAKRTRTRKPTAKAEAEDAAPAAA
jgi:hypothetical protein